VSNANVRNAPSHRFGARVLEWGRWSEIASEVERTGSDTEGTRVRAQKGGVYPVRLLDIPLPASPLIQQELRSVGGVAVQAHAVEGAPAEVGSMLLLATWEQYQRALPNLRGPPYDLAGVADEVERALQQYAAHGPRTVEGAHRSLTLGDHPRVMGVVNVTPDSFSDGGRFLDPPLAVAAALRLAEEGASVIDIGGESTRPGATPVSPDAEWARVGRVINALRDQISVPLSIDTRHPEVAAKAIEAGADLVNDVEGLRSPEMRRVVARSSAAALVMHMRGTPTTMQQDLVYGDLRGEVFRALADATDRAIGSGIRAEKLLVDPGLGFGKSAEQSLELLVHVGEFRSLGYPVVVGASRKSFLGAALGPRSASGRLEAGLAAAVIAAERGVALVRTHDVGATVRALSLVIAADRQAERPPNVPGAFASDE
jgi:dihydropteroate synthase